MADLEIKVNQDMVRGIIEQKIQAAVVAEFAKSNSQIIDELIKKGVTQKVRIGNGEPTNSDYDAEPFVQHVFKSVMRAEIKKCVQEIADEQRADLKKRIEKEILKNKNKIVEAFMDNVVNRAKDGYGFSVEIKTKD